MADEYLEAMTEEMDKPLKRLRTELARVRTGRVCMPPMRRIACPCERCAVRGARCER